MIATRHNKGNAIERMTISVALSTSMDGSEFAEADNVYQEMLKADFPRRNQGESLGLAIAAQGPLGQVPFPNRVPFLRFEKYRDDGNVLHGINLENQVIQFLWTDYDDWDKVWGDRTKPRLLKLLDCVQQREVVNIEQTYVDEFFYEGTASVFRAEMVLQKSAFLAPHIFERKLNWHSYTGFFEDIVDPERVRTLHRLNVDLLDHMEPGRDVCKLLRITCNHLAIFEQPQAVHALQAANGQRLESLMQKVHREHISIVQQMLNDGIRKQIGMNV